MSAHLWVGNALEVNSSQGQQCCHRYLLHFVLCGVSFSSPPHFLLPWPGEELEAVEYWFLGYLLCPQEGGQASLKLFAGASQRKEYDTPDTHTQTTHDTQKCTGKCSHTCTCSGNKVVRHSATCWSVCLHHSLVVDSSKCELLVQQHHKGIDKEAP